MRARHASVLALLLVTSPASAAGAGGEAKGIDVRHTAVDVSCTIDRDSHHRIARSRSAVAEFRVANACPATGKTSGACPGFDISHGWPLFCCGPDVPGNMSWLPHSAHVEFHRDLQRCSSAVPSP